MCLMVGFCCCGKFFIIFTNSVNTNCLNRNEHHKHLSFYKLSSVTAMCTHSVRGFTLGKSDFQLLPALWTVSVSVAGGESRTHVRHINKTEKKVRV